MSARSGVRNARRGLRQKARPPLECMLVAPCSWRCDQTAGQVRGTVVTSTMEPAPGGNAPHRCVTAPCGRLNKMAPRVPRGHEHQGLRRLTVLLPSSGAMEMRSVSPELPGKSVNIASTSLGTRCCSRSDVETASALPSNRRSPVTAIVDLHVDAAGIDGIAADLRPAEIRVVPAIAPAAAIEAAAG